MRNKSNLCLKSVQACCLGSLVLALSNLLALGAGLPKINIPKVPDPVRTVDRGLATITEGDAKVAHKIAEHTVAHAIKRFGIADLVTDRDIARAHDQVDLSINPSLFPPATAPTDVNRPAFNAVKSSMWIQTINVGVEFTF